MMHPHQSSLKSSIIAIIILLSMSHHPISICQCMTLPRPSSQSLQSSQSSRSSSSGTVDKLISKGLLARPHPNLYVLGTVHIGSKSAKEAEELIEAVRPKHVVVEVSPTRLRRLKEIHEKKMEEMKEIIGDEERQPQTQSQLQQQSQSQSKSKTQSQLQQQSEDDSSSKQTGFIDAVRMLPAMASAGYTKGGISGLLFSTIIVWSSLLKRSTTKTEEVETLPRVNEFEASIVAGEGVGARIIPADVEFDDLIHSVATSMNAIEWMRLGMTVLLESTNMQSSDPVRRQRGESMVEWEKRRRNVETARASRAHGERTTPELSRVLVDMRDDRFSSICLDVMDEYENEREGDSNGDDDDDDVTVCVVGLVHLDGIVDACRRRYPQQRRE